MKSFLWFAPSSLYTNKVYVCVGVEGGGGGEQLHQNDLIIRLTTLNNWGFFL